MLSNLVTQNFNNAPKNCRHDSKITDMEFTDIDKAYKQAEILTAAGYEVSINTFEDGVFVVSIERD